MNHCIIPTVFATTKSEFTQRLASVLPLARHIHLDIMDGKFVKTCSPSLSSMPRLRYSTKIFEAHLMVSHPKRYILRLKEKGVKIIIFHYESLKENRILSLIQMIRIHNLIPCIAINPETPIKKITPFLTSVDKVMIMGVHPGREHQRLLRATYKKIQELRRVDPSLIIQVDGGISQKNIRRLADAGASLFNIGSSIANAENPWKGLRGLERILTS